MFIDLQQADLSFERRCWHAELQCSARKADFLCVDDHPVVRKGIMAMMAFEGDIEPSEKLGTDRPLRPRIESSNPICATPFH